MAMVRTTQLVPLGANVRRATGPPNWANGELPSAMTDAPLPAIVVTTQLVPAQATLLIRKLPESATYMFPPRSSATPAGELNRALVPISSAQPAFVEPAIVLTTPAAVI